MSPPSDAGTSPGEGMDMKTYRMNWLLVAAMTGALVGCGDDDSSGPTDAGPRSDTGTPIDEDSGVEEGVDAGPPVDGGGETPDGELILSCTGDAPTPGDGECITEAPTPPDSAGCPAIGDRTEVSVTADIDADTTWSCENIYVLEAPIYVSAVLTVEAGTVVQGTAGANALIVTTAGRLEAEGTSVDPIVFTSNNAMGSRAPGDWGGVVLLGEAPINVEGTATIEGLDPGEARGNYGGDDAAHDCGTLRYVRIEWAGFVFGEDNELNGLTLGGCGSDTELEFIQVHGGLDDGIEFFGGTADLKHAVVSSVGDDSLDTDQGYSGRVQHFIAQVGAAGDHGQESDNLEDAETSTPRSDFTIWNATYVMAGNDADALRLRRGTAGEIHNAIIVNVGEDECVNVDTTETIGQVEAGELVIANSMFTGCTKDGADAFVRFTADEDDTTEPSEATATAWCDGNFFGVDPMLPADATNTTDPDFVPPATSPAYQTGGTPPDDGFFDADATWIGGVEPGCWDWTEGWTAYPAPAE